MTDADWIDFWSTALRGPGFTRAVNECLDNIAEAETTEELGKFCGVFGGLLRRHREHARLNLAKALMRELHIEPTIHVALMIMKQAFQQTAHIAEIDAMFALPGRVRDTQHLMDEARRRMAGRTVAFERYGNLYARYCGLQRARVKEIKAIRKAERDQQRR